MTDRRRSPPNPPQLTYKRLLTADRRRALPKPQPLAYKRLLTADRRRTPPKPQPARRAHARCAPQSLVSLAPCGAYVACARLAGCPFESHPPATAPLEDGRLATLGAATSMLPLAPSGRSRDRSLTPPQPRRWRHWRQRLPRTGVAGGEAAGCQRDLRSLAVRGPEGRSPGRATAAFIYKSSSRSLSFV